MSQESNHPNSPRDPECAVPPPLPAAVSPGDGSPIAQGHEFSAPWVKRHLLVAGLIGLVTLVGTLALVLSRPRQTTVESKVLPSSATPQISTSPRSTGEPPQPTLSKRQLVALGNEFGRNGDWPEALNCFRKVVEADSSSEWEWSWATGAALAAGQTKTCEQYCRRVLELFGTQNDPAVAERCAKQCLALPEVSGDLLAQAVERAEFAFGTDPNGRWNQYVRGLTDFRMGQWSNALERLRRPELSSQVEVAIQAWCVGAMARHQLGDTAGARRALSEANRLLAVMVRVGELGDSRNNTWDDFARAIALRREAEQLILGKVEQPPVNPQTVRDGRRQWLSLMEIAATAEQVAGRGQWSSACDQYTQLVDHPAFDWEVWELRQSVLAQQAGAVFLKAADTVRHEALCRALLTRTNSYVPSMLRERYAVVNLVRTNHLPPELVSQAIVQARTAFEESETRGDRWRVLVQILAEYRSGQYDETIQSANTLAMDTDPTVQARALIFRGMAKLRLGQKAEAQADFNEATAASSLGDRRSGWWNFALNEVALEELRQMLAGN